MRDSCCICGQALFVSEKGSGDVSRLIFPQWIFIRLGAGWIEAGIRLPLTPKRLPHDADRE